MDDLSDLVTHGLARGAERCLKDLLVVAVLLDSVFALLEALVSDSPWPGEHFFYSFLAEDWKENLSVFHVLGRYFFDLAPAFLAVALPSFEVISFVSLTRALVQRGDDLVVVSS